MLILIHKAQDQAYTMGVEPQSCPLLRNGLTKKMDVMTHCHDGEAIHLSTTFLAFAILQLLQASEHKCRSIG